MKRSPLPRPTKWLQRKTPLPRATKAIAKTNPAQRAKRRAKFAQFLRSAAWKRIVAETHRLSGFRCQREIEGIRCPHTKDTHRLVCDHVSYRRFGGDEIPGQDTRTLCTPCDRIETIAHRANHAQGFRS